ncbi:MAG: endonuclease/exonuclease/phosphatase family protein [Candidatus Obscuribacter sp.]|nr:endonuclease/exonuclease/phosphatase family protein [Candidatus Obscuribacter sp.]
MPRLLQWLKAFYTFCLCLCFCLCTLALLAITALSLFNSMGQLGELCCHLNALCLYVSLLVLLIITGDSCFFKRRLLIAKVSSVLLLSIAGLCLYRLIPFYLSVDRPRESNLSLLHLNLLGHYNHDQKTMFDQLESLKPDIVLVSELCGGWEKFLDTRMLASYPYCDNLPVSGFLRIYSKYPFKYAQLRHITYGDRARILARIDHPTLGPITIILAHPYIPLGPPGHFAARNEELAIYPKELHEFGDPAILVGDLNCTQWSPYFGKLLEDGNLKDGARGFGFAPSWPAMYSPPFLPIDHVLVTQNIMVKERRLLGAAGSDHYPLFVRLALNANL